MLVALVISPKAEAHGMRLLTGVDRSTLIETTGIDDFVAPIRKHFLIPILQSHATVAKADKI
jgi:hypothetical protein